MRHNPHTAILLLSFFVSASVYAAVPAGTTPFRKALTLFDEGNYSQAGDIFAAVDSPLSRAWSLLCAIKTGSPAADSLFRDYDEGPFSSFLFSEIHLERAFSLYNEGRYSEASAEFGRLDPRKIGSEDIAGYTFKKAWCFNETSRPDSAVAGFRKILEMPENEYSSASRFMIARDAYSKKEFALADSLFRITAADPGFKDMSEYYVLDCEFNLGNYDYAIAEGERLCPLSPSSRRERIARILSESYLVKGNDSKAREYYEMTSRENMTRKDYFYAGTVLYNVGDFEGAIENYTAMGERTDSLGQIASYHLGNAYLQVRSQVSAMEAFKAAFLADFNPRMTEDALFNYAKLSFDLNRDTSVFAEYIKRYSTTRRGESIYGYMALAALYDGDYSRALEAYDNMDSLSGEMTNNYAKANYLRAAQMISAGAWSDALPCLRACAFYLKKTDPFNQLARYWIGECLYNTDNFDQALSAYSELYNSSALDGKREGVMLPYNIAYCYFKTSRFVEASRWFDKYCGSGSAEFASDALYRRADCDFNLRDYNAAVASYQRVIDNAGNDSDIYPYYRQALSYGLSGDLKKKIEILSKVESFPSDKTLYYDSLYELGRAYMDNRDSEGAVRTFTRLKNITGDLSWKCSALIGLGMTERNSRNYEKALEYYMEVVDLLPGSQFASDAMQSIESIYRKLKQPHKYLEYVEKKKFAEEKTDKEKEEFRFFSAEQIYLAGNWSEAVKYLEKYISDYPNSDRMGECLFYLGDSHLALGNKEKAAAYLKQSCDTVSSVREACMSKYAALSFSMDHYTEAYEYYSRLLQEARLEENLVNARLGMMRSAFRARNFEDALYCAKIARADASDPGLQRECDYIQAKSLLSTSRRPEALAIFKTLSQQASTPEGAEAGYLLIQDLEDNGRFAEVENAVYDFSSKAGSQPYWLAKAYITLGDSFAERKNYRQAKATFESIRDGYVPSSSSDDVIPNVKMRLERLSKLMSE